METRITPRVKTHPRVGLGGFKRYDGIVEDLANVGAPGVPA